MEGRKNPKKYISLGYKPYLHPYTHHDKHMNEKVKRSCWCDFEICASSMSPLTAVQLKLPSWPFGPLSTDTLGLCQCANFTLPRCGFPHFRATAQGFSPPSKIRPFSRLGCKTTKQRFFYYYKLQHINTGSCCPHTFRMEEK